MDFVITRTRGLFQYGDLDGSNNSSDEVNDGDSLNLGEMEGIVSANHKMRRNKRCIWVTSILSGLVAVVIIAMTVKYRNHLRSATSDLISETKKVKKSVSLLPLARTSSLSLGPSDSEKRKMTFNNFLGYSFYPDFFNGTWLSDSEILYADQAGGLSVSDMSTKTTKTVVSHNQFSKIRPVSYHFSADRRYLLVQTSQQKVWRRSSIGNYGLLRMGSDDRPSTTQIVKLLPEDGKAADSLNQYLRYVSWAPVGNALAYVDYNNNIHYRHSAESPDIQLTTSGVVDLVYNGIPDWVSEEEVFEDNKALWWSPDGTKLVYGVFNDTDVQVVNLPRYGSWDTSSQDRQGYPFLQYPLHDTFRYPKSGTTNPTVALWSADVGAPGVKSEITQSLLEPPKSFESEEHHFTSISWQSNNSVAVIWMNRVQNISAVNVCELSQGEATCIEKFVSMERDGWIDYKFRIVFNKYKSGPRFLAILPAGSMRYRYRQLFLVDTENNNRTLLTRDESEVTEIVEWTSDDRVYFIATIAGDPGSRHLHLLTLGSSESECLTCHHTEMMPTLSHRPNCGYISVSMSKSGSYYSLECHGPGLPYSCIHHTQSNSMVTLWSDNRRLETRLVTVDSPRVEYREVAVEGTEQKAQVMIFIPPEVDRQPDKKWPMLVDVYGGPGFQKVDKQWQGYSFSAFMSGSQGVVYAVIDPRGSGFQGDAWRHAVYRRFGSVEVEDTVSVTKSLQSQLDYVDSNHTAIWGWSYGGFLSLSALARDSGGVFRCGASVAPVVRWELYDTVYTERYMSTPSDNPIGYNLSSPLGPGLSNLKSKLYYLLHGTHDDNVHYQQSMLLAAALEQKDILFRQNTYPDQDHSINAYRRHLYHSLTNFFTHDCFQL